MKKMLIVEDDAHMQFLLKRTFDREIYETQFTNDIESTKNLLSASSSDWDAIILDRSLPDGDGVELCSVINKLSQPPPVLILTAKNHLDEKIKGFTAGADDYVVKPFEPRELLARLEALFRRRPNGRAYQATVTYGDLVINLETHSTFIRPPNGADIAVDLTPIEFKILLALVRNAGKEVSRDHLVQMVWDKISLSERNIDTHICHIRKKLAQSNLVIKNRRGKGYFIEKNASFLKKVYELTAELPYMESTNGSVAYRSPH